MKPGVSLFGNKSDLYLCENKISRNQTWTLRVLSSLIYEIDNKLLSDQILLLYCYCHYNHQRCHNIKYQEVAPKY